MERRSQKDIRRGVIAHSNNTGSEIVNSESSAEADSCSARSAPESSKSWHSKRSMSCKVRIFQRYFTFRQRGIALNLVLFATIATAQFGAAIVADSLSLLGDSGSMAADTLSYGASLWAECTDSEHQQRNQLAASALSVIILLGITSIVLYRSCSILFYGADDDEEVNYYIVFGFAVVGLIFDCIGLRALVKAKREKSTNCGDLNLNAAGTHVIADLMRSMTTMIESILIWFFDFDSRITDAWSALIVSALIILPCVEMIRECVLEYIDYRHCYLELKILQDKAKKSQAANFIKKDYQTI